MLHCGHKAGKVDDTRLPLKKYQLSLLIPLDTEKNFILILRCLGGGYGLSGIYEEILGSKKNLIVLYRSGIGL